MMNRAGLAVHDRPRTNHRAAERLTDRLMAETDAENREAPLQKVDQRPTNARFILRARTRCQHDVAGIFGLNVDDRDAVVAVDLHHDPQLAAILDAIRSEWSRQGKERS